MFNWTWQEKSLGLSQLNFYIDSAEADSDDCKVPNVKFWVWVLIVKAWVYIQIPESGSDSF